MQRKKSRLVSLGIAGNDPIAQEVAQAGPWKKERRRKEKAHLPRLNFYEIRLRSHNTKLRVATAGLLLQTLAMSCAQHFDVLGMHMGLMQCDN